MGIGSVGPASGSGVPPAPARGQAQDSSVPHVQIDVPAPPPVAPPPAMVDWGVDPASGTQFFVFISQTDGTVIHQLPIQAVIDMVAEFTAKARSR
jgi:hypothetical protein